MWNGESGECQAVLIGHTDGVVCLEKHEGYMLSGSRDGSVRFWDLETCECKKTIEQVGHWVHSIVSCGYDGKIMFGTRNVLEWNSYFPKRVTPWNGHKNCVGSITKHNEGIDCIL